MPPAPLTSAEILRSSWARTTGTRDLRHMLPIPRLERGNNLKIARERIKYWNFVSGDKVRVRGHKIKDMLEVTDVNKITNRVRLRVPPAEGEEKKTTPPGEEEERDRTWNVHYSRLQLFVRMHQFPGRKLPQPVYATRLGRSKQWWNQAAGIWNWKRYALSSNPRLPSEILKQPIPWPKFVKEEDKDREPHELYDTATSAVEEITYTFPTEEELLGLGAPDVEEAYVKSLYYPPSVAPSHATPVEVFVTRELSNPYSRAKKQARWQARMAYKRELLGDMVKAEVANLRGRTRREARAEAAWKWKQTLDAEDKAEARRRAELRGDVARTEGRRVRKERREKKKEKLLERLVLQDAPNQVIPT
ncbi:hypothetical protein PENSPDRAFT_746934 [Peniophora sp. CONT]|nr:hypothetical protein PENSPDRAFT_746934 [Peniophora sp. CONT]